MVSKAGSVEIDGIRSSANRRSKAASSALKGLGMDSAKLKELENNKSGKEVMEEINANEAAIACSIDNGDDCEMCSG